MHVFIYTSPRFVALPSSLTTPPPTHKYTGTIYTHITGNPWASSTARASIASSKSSFLTAHFCTTFRQPSALTANCLFGGNPPCPPGVGAASTPPSAGAPTVTALISATTPPLPEQLAGGSDSCCRSAAFSSSNSRNLDISRNFCTCQGLPNREDWSASSLPSRPPVSSPMASRSSFVALAYTYICACVRACVCTHTHIHKTQGGTAHASGSFTRRNDGDASLSAPSHPPAPSPTRPRAPALAMPPAASPDSTTSSLCICAMDQSICM